ncbi:MAG: LysM peptidoglycan-binding domain-containing protein [Bacteroidales bacterium]|nr:LysM peptidoglycan-binding domain-containing protein [Bacteroidales bacterium]
MRHRLLRYILVAFSLIISGVCAQALDLPTKRVKGVEYYYYKVKKGESLYGISRNLGLTPDEIIRYNPAQANGVHKDDMLIFPVADFQEAAVAEDVAQPEAPAAIVVEEEVAAEVRPSIAVLLPFGLSSAEPSKQNKLALDFYKGFLIATDSLSERSKGLEIIARDTEGLTPEALKKLIATDEALSTAAVIIAPDDEKSIHAIAGAAAQNGTFVFNTLNIRDSLYLTAPNVLQANVPQHTMYRLAVDGLMDTYAGYTPVILHNTEGRNEKESFVDYLTGRYRAIGTEPIIVSYNTNLLMANLEELPAAADEKYVFVPSSGSLAEFNRFAYILKSYRDLLAARAEEAEEGTAVATAEVFGYPDWTAFRGEALDLLHRLDATVYSRFLDEPEGFETRNIAAAFRRWFGGSMIESIPTYGLLGFDTANYLIRNLNANGGEFDPQSPRSYTGIQSAFDFEQSGEGYVNSTLYIINYQPGGRIAARQQ